MLDLRSIACPHHPTCSAWNTSNLDTKDSYGSDTPSYGSNLSVNLSAGRIDFLGISSTLTEVLGTITEPLAPAGLAPAGRSPAGGAPAGLAGTLAGSSPGNLLCSRS